MQRKGYTPPSLDTLIETAGSLPDAYHEVRHDKVNVTREQQIALVTLIHEKLRALKLQDHRDVLYPDELLSFYSIGAWAVLLESIEAEYWGRDPSQRTVCFVPKGSALYHIVTKNLGITEKNSLSDVERLIYLAGTYAFLKDQDILNKEGLLLQIESALSLVFGRIRKGFDELIASVPTEEALITYLSELYNKYAESRLVPQSFFSPSVAMARPFCAQLAQASATLIAEDAFEDCKMHSERSYKVLVGFLIYMMRTIPGNSSKLYQLCQSIMNGTPDSLSPAAQFDCLVALDNFLKDSAHVAKITAQGEKLFEPTEADKQLKYPKKNLLKNLETHLRQMSMDIESELKKLNPEDNNPLIGAKVMGAAAALGLYPTGHGTGSVLGCVGARIEHPINAGFKTWLTKFFNRHADLPFGINMHGVGYVFTPPLVEAVFSQYAAEFFGAAFAIAGGVAAASLGYLVIDLALRSLIQYAMQGYGNHYRNLYTAEHARPQLFTALHQLPKTIISESDQKKLDHVCPSRAN